MKRPVQHLLETRLQTLDPSKLVIENESHKHSRSSSESHFKVFIVSQRFDSVTKLDRQRLVHRTIGEPLPCHALSIRAVTPAEFAANPSLEGTFVSPSCLGGEKH